MLSGQPTPSKKPPDYRGDFLTSQGHTRIALTGQPLTHGPNDGRLSNSKGGILGKTAYRGEGSIITSGVSLPISREVLQQRGVVSRHIP